MKNMELQSVIIIIVILLVILITIGTVHWASFSFIGKANLFDGEVKNSSDIEMLIRNAQKIPAISYEIVTVYPDGFPNSKYWQKNELSRKEIIVDGRKEITIVNGKERVAYDYFPDIAVARKKDFYGMNVEEMKREFFSSSIIERGFLSLKYNPNIIGEDIIDGKECVIISFVETVKMITEVISTVDETGIPKEEFKTENVENEVKMWIWKDYGIPVRFETETYSGKTIEKVINISLDNISNKMFMFPKNIHIIEELRR
jgi:hypothetical protein